MARRSAQNSGAEQPKRKPRGKPFTKGRDGRRNNGGVPKSVREVKALAAADAEKLWGYLMKRAAKGDRFLIKAGLEWALGKPRMTVEMTGKDGQPLEMKASVQVDDEPSTRTAAIIAALERAGVVVASVAVEGAATAADAEADAVHPAPAASDTGGVPSP
jgi:hypothetical protein